VERAIPRDKARTRLLAALSDSVRAPDVRWAIRSAQVHNRARRGHGQSQRRPTNTHNHTTSSDSRRWRIPPAAQWKTHDGTRTLFLGSQKQLGDGVIRGGRDPGRHLYSTRTSRGKRLWSPDPRFWRARSTELGWAVAPNCARKTGSVEQRQRSSLTRGCDRPSGPTIQWSARAVGEAGLGTREGEKVLGQNSPQAALLRSLVFFFCFIFLFLNLHLNFQFVLNLFLVRCTI
jgi:hypothetical protein